MQLPSDQELYGYVAQEVEKVIPEAVRHDKSGYLSMYSDPILLALVNAVKELNAQKRRSAGADQKIAKTVMLPVGWFTAKAVRTRSWSSFLSFIKSHTRRSRYVQVFI